ncbi:AbrB family transcriptional regulator [Paenibacillus beijingensis]|uniref:AbrB family transcriptional regulator n=1 Tax=Paenibacillus beijingensis TaxID=1126833 RepID=A0A0D5NI48_9BACL|nr:AbrB family transcriptional regulator [Paenibacillus beijingensis]AJY75064.1 AbrB family transcriptional regulator [Paenibacillus beijingensis]
MFSLKGITKTHLLQLIKSVIIASAGGLLFALLHFPLAWMLGPLTSVLVWQIAAKKKLYWPTGFRNGGQILLGYSMGLSFTAESARQIAASLPSMVMSTALLTGSSLVFAFLIARQTGISMPSSIMGCIPGGISQMVPLSEEIKGAEPTIVTFMQTIRMLVVTFMVPFLAVHGLADADAADNLAQSQTLAGLPAADPSWLMIAAAVVLVGLSAIFAVRFKFPNPWLIGPLIASAVFSASGIEFPHLPQLIIIIAQLCIGIYLGQGIKLKALSGWRRLLPYSLAGSILLVGMTLAISYVLSLTQPISFVTAFLSIAPGGLPEMGVTAAAIHADVSKVAAYQLFRVFFVLFIVPIVLKRIFSKPFNRQHSQDYS